MSKKGGQPKGKGVAKPTTAAKIEATPLQELLTNLFEQSEARLVKAEQRSSKDVVKKVVAGLEPVALAMVKESKLEGLQKHAVKAVLAVNKETTLGPAQAKKVVSIFFTVLADELQYHWKDFGLKEADVHPDFHIEFEPYNKKDGQTFYWDAPDVSASDYDNWEKAWDFLHA
jgi:hypothetical protein